MNTTSSDKTLKALLLGLTLPLLMLADFSAQEPMRLALVQDAAAVVGRPLTPVSYAGVARRTTRRTVAATSSSAAAANSAAAASSAAAAESAAASAAAAESAAHAAAAATPAGPPLGSTIAALPAGCASTVIGDVEYFDCGGGVFYRAAFQGNNLVYVATKP